MIIKGKSTNGFEYSIDSAAPESWDFLDAAVRLQKGDLTGAVDIVNILFPGEEKNRFMQHIAELDPSRPTTLVIEECNDIINGLKTAKKSMPSQD